MSTLTGTILDDIHKVYPQYELHIISCALALIIGCIVCAFGIFRIGFLVDFIPLPALTAFMTGSAINIAMGQIPTMMGNNKFFDTRQSTYLVFINFWKNIKHCNLNAALGLTALVLLYLIRFICTRGIRHYPDRAKIFFFINTLRTVFVILVYLLISWLINREDPSHPRTALLGNVPRGFQNIAVPYIDGKIFSALIPYLPSSIIVLLIEHIAIAKSFGRINNYTIDPNQELIAIGITNIFGPFFGGYPSTGSFSRTAIKSKSGVRTPLAGVVTGIVIILAIYVLTPVFFWISQASLAAVIIHAVGDLIVGLRTLKQFWQVSPIEFFIFWIGVIVTIFSNIENGIYVSILTSAALLLYRIAKAQGEFLGRIRIHQIRSTSDNNVCSTRRNIYIPLNHSDGTNPMINLVSPGNGIFIYRIYESFLYPNAANYMEKMVHQIFRETRAGKTIAYSNLGEQPWNLQTGRHPEKEHHLNDTRPRLHALILDFTGVPHIDTTALQNLVDVRRQLDNYADWKVDWHFVGLSNAWIKRALISCDFGFSDYHHTVFSVANVHSDLNHEDDDDDNERNNAQQEDYPSTDLSLSTNTVVPILDVDRPSFHVDLDEAYKAALASLSVRQRTDR
jgi:sodium-independent sulfate anion transporter 11